MSPYRRGGDLRPSAPRPPGQRRGNRIFYTVAEGEGTEYDYLSHLNTTYGADCGFLIRWPSQRRGLSPAQVINEARSAIGEPGIEVWGLFDHDGRTDIDQVCASAHRDGIRAALSHPSFELWLLLHFRDFPPAAQSGSNRVIIEKLRASHPAFADYREGSKRIDLQRFEALAGNDGIRRATERARRLAAGFINQTPSNRDPSTDISELIHKLGIVPPTR